MVKLTVDLCLGASDGLLYLGRVENFLNHGQLEMFTIKMCHPAQNYDVVGLKDCLGCISVYFMSNC